MSTKKFTLLVIGFAVALLTVAVVLKPVTPEPYPHVNQLGNAHNLTVYKSPTCGCCSNWVTYMKNKDYQIDVVNIDKEDELNKIKEEQGVPESLYACHTTIINEGQYFVEGHIPEEAIVKLMNEEPNIRGIGMPGMPSASPGMPGQKVAPFDITQVDENSKTSQYMSI